ncbi:ROK family transcriptional regulator [Devosia limi DSM 17137]|uniref:ROK family transcriptional regulator n=1 Tax=Devosia limi DSM 17137 TaxID=1121477 RepID=A0A0F5LUD1_9HYPH|nr:ROK family transcriptional regulator [Devosia limi]KKB85891.1 ROK family transcriptional regulator [Devosia limi DSM 17137]SHF68050.1 Sugar kinase of the NBD/HSP70 family, may contain an N-terminal HTH domain [Devosia limi DSM 17137]
MADASRNRSGDLNRGTNQIGVRLYNERLVLSLIRQHGTLPKADIARMTGLSPQTISIIINQLEADGLLRRGNVVRGRVGQPSVPYSLNPEGAFAFGLKIGRRSVDLYLINFVGEVQCLLHQTYAYPTPQGVQDFAVAGLSQLQADLSATTVARIAGLGIAAPYEMWTWAEEIGAPVADIAAWRNVDIRARLAQLCDWPVYYSNDITAACAAELMFGRGADYVDYLYVYIGSFIGGGLVLDGHLFPGRTRNAAALGSMPAHNRLPGHRPGQLMGVASIYVLERKLIEQGRRAEILWQSPDDWGDNLGPALDNWIEEVAESLAYAIVAAIAVIDVETVVIDGAFPVSVRKRIIERTRLAIDSVNQQGLSPFALVEGSLGNGARAMGGAAIPLLANFTQDREVLFKENN